MTQNSVKVAVTGGIGSGKSLVCALIKDRGFPVFSCDEIYREEVCIDREYLKKIEENFPGAVKEGVLQREYLSKIVFSDEKSRKKLDALSHPLIKARLFEKMERYPLSFAEVPLLFETRMEKYFDRVLIVSREREHRVAAVMARDGISREEALLRIRAQRDWDAPHLSAQILQNDGSIDSLRRQIESFLDEILG